MVLTNSAESPLTPALSPTPPPPPPLRPPPLPPPLPNERRPDQSNSSIQLRKYSDADYRSMIDRELSSSSSSSSSSSFTLSLLMPDSVVDGVLQQGPCCGIVALHMALAQLTLKRRIAEESVAHNDSIASVEELMQTAKDEKYTSFGEMFSCDNLASLTRSYLPSSFQVRVQSFLDLDEESSEKMIRDHFSFGGLILAPYDKDVDFRPCMKRGATAHWALLFGMATVEESEGEEKRNQMLPSRRVFVAARHGKSRRIAMWDWSDLLKSNEQLEEYDLDKLRRDNDCTSAENDFVEPVIPDGGLSEGLKGKMIFICG